MRFAVVLFFFSSALFANAGTGFTHEFFPSIGYNSCGSQFLDLGLRYYHWKNDGQTAMAFAGMAVGCEFGTKPVEQTTLTENIRIPYLGWQGQCLLLGYGLRA